MKRNQFFLLLAMGSLLGCTNMTTAASADNWIVDDGAMELTPEYTVQHVQGQPYSDVYAAFTFNPQKKQVRLREGDTITVNGYVLLGTPNVQGFFYKARLPLAEGAFTFTLTRSPGRRMTHSFELPTLGIREAPKGYHPYETLRVPVQYVEPPAYVGDTYSLPINGGVLRFTLDSKRWKKDNRYQFDRLPDIQDGAIVFRHITERAPPPGTYPAEIYRQHRIVLSEMSGASRTGWATLTNTMPFTIEVK
jgi:hypothetical protein